MAFSSTSGAAPSKARSTWENPFLFDGIPEFDTPVDETMPLAQEKGQSKEETRGPEIAKDGMTGYMGKTSPTSEVAKDGQTGDLTYSGHRG